MALFNSIFSNQIHVVIVGYMVKLSALRVV